MLSPLGGAMVFHVIHFCLQRCARFFLLLRNKNKCAYNDTLPPAGLEEEERKGKIKISFFGRNK